MLDYNQDLHTQLTQAHEAVCRVSLQKDIEVKELQGNLDKAIRLNAPADIFRHSLKTLLEHRADSPIHASSCQTSRPSGHFSFTCDAARPLDVRDPFARVRTRSTRADVDINNTLFILNGNVVRVPPSWLTSHPGGNLAILRHVGRDATDEVDAFHSDETLQKMKGSVVGRVELGEDGWVPFVPPIANGWVRRMGRDGKMEWYNEARPLKSTEDSDTSPASQILLKKAQAGAEETQTGPMLAQLQPTPNKLSPKTEKMHSDAYKELHKRVIDAGLYKTRFITGYGPEFVRYTLLALVSAVCYYKGWLVASALFLGLFWQQLTFFAHDLGHVGVTHDWTLDRLISIFVADLIGGMSIGWWVNNHNVHHCKSLSVSPLNDYDNERMRLKWSLTIPLTTPTFSTSPSLPSPPSSSTPSGPPITSHKLSYIVLSLTRFNLYANSYGYLAKTAFEPKRFRGGRWWWWTEVLCLGLFFAWFGAVLKGCGSWPNILTYLLVSHVAASPVHVQIVLSHFSRSTADFGPVESFFARQLRTTVDVICSPHIEFIHGGLHLQVTHHLFPRLPRHNLHEASLIVKEFAKERGLEYADGIMMWSRI
ncbi:fatty acid/sphingolipid desaturase [Lentinus brumalis]|uniref:Delta 8-(E)-sphingolipid desaturase n=1 Tax=Lentinus brumalis TaxID=2498619 RepID=A0A371D5A3_9APHY|nr:fatty acid/sphingolipid desaturase [Polyporus brumalis]